jgi:type I restriction enzyme, S subunit
LKRLEITEVNFNQISDTDLLRLEAEFYTAPSFEMKNSYSGSQIIDFVQYGTSKELNELGEGYPILRLNEFDSSFISKPSKYCSIIDNNTYQSLKLHKDDVLICRTNGNYRYVGKSALVPKDYDFAYASYLFKVRPKNNLINSSTLVTFLNSKYGRIEIEKYSMASNQVNFSPAKFRQLRIPKLSKDFNSLIEEMTYKAFDLLTVSSDLYQQAEKILLDEVGFNNFIPSSETVNIKNFKTSFDYTGRLDAEYYQPKYESFNNLIQNYSNGFEKLSIACSINLSNFKPDNDITYKYIELSNIGNNGDIKGCTIEKGIDLPSRARRIVHTGDVIISSIEGSLQSCAIITEDYNDSLCSTGFYVINSNKINSETLLVLFKSILIQNILKQNCSGTILTGLNKDEFSNIPIPMIVESIQIQISELISKSFSLKAQSENLLKSAKRAIETAIENDEVTAIRLLAEKAK